MNVPATLRYTDSHECVRTESDGALTIGITDYAQEALGDLVFVELPAVGRQLASGEACAVVESVKAASDVYAPVAGEVVAINDALAQQPESLNTDPYGAWLFKLRPLDGDVARLQDAATYEASLAAAK
jgi:glycine cleavage system H protein